MKNDYVAWLGGQSVAVGGLREVREKALSIAALPTFLQFGYTANGTVQLKITRGARQYFVESQILHKPEEHS